jgi:hypothetical protein
LGCCYFYSTFSFYSATGFGGAFASYLDLAGSLAFLRFSCFGFGYSGSGWASSTTGGCFLDDHSSGSESDVEKILKQKK